MENLLIGRFEKDLNIIKFVLGGHLRFYVLKWLLVNRLFPAKIIFNFTSKFKKDDLILKMNFLSRAIVNQRYTCPSSFSSELTDLIKKMLVIDVTTRLGCMANGNKDIQNHPFFDSVNFVKIYHQSENPNNIPCRLNMQTNEIEILVFFNID
jgi:serine/threonine protein kinase